MSVAYSPIARRKRLGAELRKLREARKLTGDQVIERVGWPSASKLSRIENGRSRPDLSDIMDLLDAYEVTGPKRDELVTLTREAATARGWWTTSGDAPRQRSYAELEAGALDIRESHQVYMPGLLQSEDYARVRMGSGRGLTPQGFNRDKAIAARLERQKILTRTDDPVRYEAVLDEAVLRRQAAPPKVMADQFAHLAAMARRDNIVLRVLPFNTALPAFFIPHTSFSIYRFVEPDDPEIVVIETMTSDAQLTDDEIVAGYRLVFDRLREAALQPEESVRLLASLAEQS